MDKNITGYLRPFVAEDFLRSTTRNLIARVAGIWDTHVAPESDYMGRRDVLLVGLGDWFHQGAWHDETGFFLSFRLNPSHAHLATVQAKGRAVLKAFIALFPSYKGTTTYNEEAIDDGSGAPSPWSSRPGATRSAIETLLCKLHLPRGRIGP